MISKPTRFIRFIRTTITPSGTVKTSFEEPKAPLQKSEKEVNYFAEERTSTDTEFYGLPLSKMQPRTAEEVKMKLQKEFPTIEALLSFYETNRDYFADEDSLNHFMRKLIAMGKTERIKKEKTTAQVQMIINDYVKHCPFRETLNNFNQIALVMNWFVKNKRFSS